MNLTVDFTSLMLFSLMADTAGHWMCSYYSRPSCRTEEKRPYTHKIRCGECTNLQTIWEVTTLKKYYFVLFFRTVLIEVLELSDFTKSHGIFLGC